MMKWVLAVLVVGGAVAGWFLYQRHAQKKVETAIVRLVCETDLVRRAAAPMAAFARPEALARTTLADLRASAAGMKSRMRELAVEVRGALAEFGLSAPATRDLPLRDPEKMTKLLSAVTSAAMSRCPQQAGDQTRLALGLGAALAAAAAAP